MSNEEWNIRKIKNFLENPQIHVIHYYIVKGTNVCYMLKLYFKPVMEFLLVYIPKNSRFILDEKQENILTIEEIDETTEKDDYCNTQRQPEYNLISTNTNHNIYNTMTDKYNKTIHTEGFDEPIIRKMKRQLARLNIPFKKLNYSIALQYSNIISFNLGEETRIFSSKLKENSQKHICYFLELNQLDNLDTVENELNTMKYQLYNMIHRICLNTMEEIKTYISNYKKVVSSFTDSSEQFNKALVTYTKDYTKLKEKEEILITNTKTSIKLAEGSAKIIIQDKTRKELEIIYKNRNDLLIKVTNIIGKYHSTLLTIEQISFDTTLMIHRVNSNLLKLEQLFE